MKRINDQPSSTGERFEVSIKKNTVYNILKKCAALISPLVIFPYISRVLQPDNLGKVNFAVTYVGYFSLIASLGVETYAIRECSAKRYDKQALGNLASEIFSINIYSSLIAYALLILPLFFSNRLQNYTWLILIQSLSIGFVTIGADWLNSAMEDFKYITIRTICVQVCSLFIILFFIKSSDDYYKYLVITVIGVAATNVINYFYRKRYCTVRFIKKPAFSDHYKPIVILFVMILAQSIFQRIDILMLGIMKGDHEVGVYSVVYNVYLLIGEPVYSVFLVVLSRLSLYFARNEYAKSRDLLDKVFDYTMLLGIPCCVGVFVLAKEVILIIGGKEYIDGVGILRVLMIGMLFNLFSGFEGNMILLPSKRENYFMKASCLIAVFNMIVNYILIPNHGGMGAAFATAASILLMAIVLGFQARSFMPRVRKMFRFVAVPALGSAIMALYIVFVRGLLTGLISRTIVSVAGGIVIYFAAMILLKDPLSLHGLGLLKERIKKG